MKKQGTGNRVQGIKSSFSLLVGSELAGKPSVPLPPNPAHCLLFSSSWSLFLLMPLVMGRGAFYNPSNTAKEGVVLFTRRPGFGRRKERLRIP
jgi:hypothetical protein